MKDIGGNCLALIEVYQASYLLASSSSTGVVGMWNMEESTYSGAFDVRVQSIWRFRTFSRDDSDDEDDEDEWVAN